MTFENSQSQADFKEDPSVNSHTIVHRGVFDRFRNKFSTALAIGGSFIGMSDRAAEHVQAQDPASPRVTDVAMAPSSSISTPSLAEDPQLKIDEFKVKIRNKYKLEFGRTETAKGMSQIMQARSLLPRLVSEIPKVADEFERKAIHDLVFEMATVAGKHKEALFSNMVLTPETDQFTAAYFEKEVDILQSARANEANTSAKLVQIEIQNELNERKAILESLKILQMNPADAEHNQKVGEYIFFEEGSSKGLFYLANGTNPLHRTLAVQMNNAAAWWDAFASETNPKFKMRLKEYALQTYLKNPTAYSPEQQAVFETGLKALSVILKAAQMRAPLSLTSAVAAPEIKEASANPQASVESKDATWINGLQMIPKAPGGNIVPNGRGGVLLKGKDVASGILTLPFEAVGEYDVTSEFVEGDGTGNIVYILPIGSSSCMLLKGPDYIGIDMIKGMRAAGNQTTKKDMVLQKGVPHKIAISVRKGKEDNSANLKVYIDGKLCTEYEGDISDFSITKGWDKGKYVFAIGNNQTNVDIVSYAINMVSGTIKPKMQ